MRTFFIGNLQCEDDGKEIKVFDKSRPLYTPQTWFVQGEIVRELQRINEAIGKLQLDKTKKKGATGGAVNSIERS